MNEEKGELPIEVTENESEKESLKSKVLAEMKNTNMTIEEINEFQSIWRNFKHMTIFNNDERESNKKIKKESITEPRVGDDTNFILESNEVAINKPEEIEEKTNDIQKLDKETKPVQKKMDKCEQKAVTKKRKYPQLLLDDFEELLDKETMWRGDKHSCTLEETIDKDLNKIKIDESYYFVQLSDLSVKMEELEDVKVKIELQEVDEDPHSIGLTTFIRQPDLDIKQDSESELVKENKKLQILTRDIPMTDTEKQNRKCPKAMAVMMKPSLLKALYKCPKYDCSFATTSPLSFEKHFSSHHSILDDTLVPCLYCDYKVSRNFYLTHLEVKHGNCLFGCANCFYRATHLLFFKLHHELTHPNTEFRILQLQVVASNKNTTTSLDLNELIPPYNCRDDGIPSCSFKTLYFDEYLKHVEAIHQVTGLGSFSSEHKAQREAVMEGWLAKEVGPFQCRYCKKATDVYQEMEKHQEEFHVQEQCLFYYRKFVPNDIVVIPEQVNLEDPSFINHLIHLPDQIHLCDFMPTDDSPPSTSTNTANEEPEVPLPLLPLPAKDIKTELDQLSVSLDEPETLIMFLKEEPCLLDESDPLCPDEQPRDDSTHDDFTVTAYKLQCKWKGCCRNYHSQTALLEHIQKDHVLLQRGKEFTCFWLNCPRKSKPYPSKRNLSIHMSFHCGEKPYKCSFQGCNEAFSGLESLKTHHKSHTEEGPYLCGFPNCYRSFSSSSIRNNHQRMHYDTETYTCQVTGCSKNFTDRGSFSKHMKDHRVDKQLEAKQKKNDFVSKMISTKLQCKWRGCNQTYNSQRALGRHIQKDHVLLQKGDQFTCFWNNCPRKAKPFTIKQSLTIHMRIHSGEKPYKCTFEGCNKACMLLSTLRIHQRKHTGERPYLCQFQGCNSAFSHQVTLRAHHSRHTGKRPYLCQFPTCFRSFLYSFNRDEHQKTHYQMKKLTKEILFYSCQVSSCSEKYTNPESLWKHLKTHTVDEQLKVKSSDNFEDVKHPKTDYDTLQCKWKDCYESYDTQMALAKHIQRNHVRVQRGEEFNCFWTNCSNKSKPFSTSQKLSVHMRMHTRGEPIKCPFQGCNKKFSLMSALKIHQRKHTGERPYLCRFPNCSKSFTSSSYRAKHQRTHVPEIYTCKVSGCSKQFTNPCGLWRHKMKSHTN